MLAMCCVGHLGCEPVLIGPSVLERVLVDALPRAAITPDRCGKAVPQAVRAWTDWLAERNKLTDRSRRRLGFSLRATLVRFAGAWYGPGAQPLRRYLEDLNDEDASTGNVVNAVIERRGFAGPLPGERGDGLAGGRGGGGRQGRRPGRAGRSDPDLATVGEAGAAARSVSGSGPAAGAGRRVAARCPVPSTRGHPVSEAANGPVQGARRRVPLGAELIDSEVALTHWTGPDGTRLEETSLPVDGDEVCASTPTGDLEPYSSEYEGYMGNWGNTLDRWDHRAAVAVGPRDQALAARAETSPPW